MHHRFIVFSFNEIQYGIEMVNVQSVLLYQAVTKIPSAPTITKGLINLRGSIVPLIDMQYLLEKKETLEFDKHQIIVMNIKSRFVCMLALNIKELHVPEIETNQANLSAMPLLGVAHLNQEKVLLLDIVKIFDDLVF